MVNELCFFTSTQIPLRKSENLTEMMITINHQQRTMCIERFLHLNVLFSTRTLQVFLQAPKATGKKRRKKKPKNVRRKSKSWSNSILRPRFEIFRSITACVSATEQCCCCCEWFETISRWWRFSIDFLGEIWVLSVRTFEKKTHNNWKHSLRAKKC